MMNKNCSRKCIATNQILKKSALIRFNLDKNNIISLDKNKILQGRGAYISKDKLIIEMALKKRLLNRSFKQKISIEIYNRLQKEIDQWLN